MLVTSEDKAKLKGEWLFIFDNGRKIITKNKIVYTGLEFIAKLITGEQNNSSGLSPYLAIGTSSIPALSTDELLGAEAFRKAVSAVIRDGSLVRFRTVMLSSEANGDWQEFGIFLAATSQPNSGVMLNRAVKPISKTSRETLTIEVRVPISNE